MRLQKKSKCTILLFESDRKLEKAVRNRSKSNFYGPLKAFDIINYSLLLAKLKAYSFSDQALSLLQSYLLNRFQRSIINGSFSSWKEIITEVPQDSVLGPLLVSTFLNDIFLFISKCQLCNYADVNTFYKSGKSMQKIKRSGNGFHDFTQLVS